MEFKEETMPPIKAFEATPSNDAKSTEVVHCIICESNDWKNVDEFRFKPGGMCMCNKCGFITYPEAIRKAKDLKEFYREEYRQAPTVQNIFNQQRKLQYHNDFIGEVFKAWQQNQFEGPKILEIGAAFGMFLKWVRDIFPKSFLFGTELTKSYVRNAWHSFKIRLDEDFDDAQKYDMIVSYKVAEHIPNIDREMKRYLKCLNPKGYLYISVPTWFDTLHNFGATGYSLDYYYHSNHINVWTRKHFEYLLQKTGFKIIKTNYCIYDSTYLCQLSDNIETITRGYEDPMRIVENLDKIKKASMAHDEARFEDAIALWPNFPEAHISAYEIKRNSFHQKKFEGIQTEVIDRMIKCCPDTAQTYVFAGDLSMRYNQWDKALKYFEQALKMKPNEPNSLSAVAHVFRNLADQTHDPTLKTKYITEARDATRFLKQISLQHTHDAITWEFNDQAKIPCPWE